MAIPIPDNNLPIYPQDYTIGIFPAGKEIFSCMALLPSNKKKKRVLQLVFSGQFKNSEPFVEIVYDLKGVDFFGYLISLEGAGAEYRVQDEQSSFQSHPLFL